MTRGRIRSGWVLGVFFVVCLAQVAVPARMLWVREHTLQTGERFRFRCLPVDPVDALRGRYVALGFEAADAPPTHENLRFGQRVAVAVETGPDGFARLGPPSPGPPETGPWVRVRFAGSRVHDDGEISRVDLPFDRFYMKETVAPEVEAALRDRSEERVEAWLAVRILDGLAVPEELYLDGLPVREYLDREAVSPGSRQP